MQRTEKSADPKTLYNDTASSWVRSQPLSLSDFTGRPAVLLLCQPLEGLRVLDLGCGEGYCARQLATFGAREILGMDLSPKMIEAAIDQERRDPQGIKYEVSDATSTTGGLTSLGDSSFDLCLSMFMFNYLTLEQTGYVMSGIHRILRPGGRFVLAVPHPSLAFLRKAEPPFYFNLADAGYISGRDRRFPGKIWKRDGSHLEVQMVHKTFEDYFNALKMAGFRELPIVRELAVTPDILSVDPPFFRPLLDIPLHLALSITKSA